MILSNDGLVAFHYRSYGTFFLQQNRLHNIHRGLPTTNSIEPLKWIADKVSGWGDHYQLVAQKLVLKRAISKPVLEKHGLVSCLDYYLERHALKVS